MTEIVGQGLIMGPTRTSSRSTRDLGRGLSCTGVGPARRLFITDGLRKVVGRWAQYQAFQWLPGVEARYL